MQPKKISKINRLQRGFVYILYNPVFARWYKIGATKDPARRLTEYKAHMPSEFGAGWEFRRIYQTDKMYELETELIDTAARMPYLSQDPNKREWFKKHGGASTYIRMAPFDAVATRFSAEKL